MYAIEYVSPTGKVCSKYPGAEVFGECISCPHGAYFTGHSQCTTCLAMMTSDLAMMTSETTASASIGYCISPPCDLGFGFIKKKYM